MARWFISLHLKPKSNQMLLLVAQCLVTNYHLGQNEVNFRDILGGKSARLRRLCVIVFRDVSLAEPWEAHGPPCPWSGEQKSHHLSTISHHPNAPGETEARGAVGHAGRLRSLYAEINRMLTTQPLSKPFPINPCKMQKLCKYLVNT